MEKYYKSTARGITLAYSKTVVSGQWDGCELILVTNKNDVIGMNADCNIVKLKYSKNNHDMFCRLWEVAAWLFEISKEEFEVDFKLYIENMLGEKN